MALADRPGRALALARARGRARALGGRDVETAGEPDPRTGVVERVDENELLRIRWWPLEDEDAATTVEFELGDDPAGTRVRVTETEGVPASASARPRALACA